MDPMGRLHKTLDRRPPPEVVCKLILDACGQQFTPAQRRVLERASSPAAWTYSSMSEDFDRPVAAVHKVRTLMALFGKQLSDESVMRMASDPWMLLGQLQFLAPFLGWMGGDFTAAPPLNRQQRAAMGIDMSRRRYRRLVRQMRQTQQHAQGLQQQVLLRQLRLVASSGMAYSITVEEMRADPAAAAFVAYWSAQRRARRDDGGPNPYDVVAELLLGRCEFAGDRTDWWMIARAFPHRDVLARIGDQRRGELMAQWMQFMRLAADLLKQVLAQARPVGFDEARMVQVAGMDSWTWNLLAFCYNQARAGWIACLDAAGSLRLLNAVCPGKAMRVVTADPVTFRVARVDPQIAVWTALPKPWEVLGGVSCTARTVELVCRQHGVDPRGTGWTAPQPDGEVALWVPTPELVHGIEIGDPLWAGVLRSAGTFAGQTRPAWAGSNVVQEYLTERQETT